MGALETGSRERPRRAGQRLLDLSSGAREDGTGLTLLEAVEYLVEAAAMD